MRVLLWGAYEQGNFGDDLMAVIFAQNIKKFGHEVTVFGLDSQEAARFSLVATEELEQAVAECDIVVLGGGAVLKQADLLRTVLKPDTRRLETNYLRLRSAIKRHNKELVMASIGSDGVHTKYELSLFRRLLLSDKRCSRATVRLRDDVELLKHFSIEAAFFPDILFSTQAQFGYLERNVDSSGGVSKVLLNLHKKHEVTGAALIEEIQRKWPRARIFASSSHLPESGFTYEWNPQLPNVEWMPYQGVNGMLSLLSEVDVVFSSKLHVGLTAMSLGAVFYSVGGKDKVIRQFNELGIAEFGLIEGNEASSEVIGAHLNSYSEFRRTLGTVVPKVVREALEHIAFLETTLQREAILDSRKTNAT